MTDTTVSKSKKKYPTLCVRINTTLRSHLDNTAFARGITRGEVVRRILTEHFSNPTFMTRDFHLYESQIFDGPQGAQGAGSSVTGSWLDDELDFTKTQQGPTGPFTDLYSAEKGFTQQGTTGPIAYQPQSK